MKHTTATKGLAALIFALTLSSCAKPTEKENLFSCIDRQKGTDTKHTLLYRYNRPERTIRLVSVDGNTSAGGSAIATKTKEEDGKITWKDKSPDFGESISTIDTKSMEWKTTNSGETKLTWKCAWEKVHS